MDESRLLASLQFLASRVPSVTARRRLWIFQMLSGFLQRFKSVGLTIFINAAKPGKGRRSRPCDWNARM